MGGGGRNGLELIAQGWGAITGARLMKRCSPRRTLVCKDGLCALLLSAGRLLSLCNSPSDEMCLKRWIGIGGAVLTRLWGIHLQPSATVMKGRGRRGGGGGGGRPGEIEGRERESGGGRETFCSETLPQKKKKPHHYTGPWPAVKTRLWRQEQLFLHPSGVCSTRKRHFMIPFRFRYI